MAEAKAEPSAQEFQALLAAAQAKAEANDSKIEFTKDETEKFKRAFDDPEFRRMFSEYVDEMSDPKNREETELYISQLEGEQKVPQGKELIRPTASFVAKTHKLKDNTKESAKGDKIWLNIVHSDKIAEPRKTSTPEGESWSLPYSLGPPHMERDQKETNVAAFDCCFHPTAIKLSTERKQFRDLLVQTAIEGVEMAFKRQGQETTVSKEFHVLKGVTYKSGQIPAMMVDLSSKKEWDGSEEGDAGKPPATGSKATGSKASLAQAAAGAAVAAAGGAAAAATGLPPQPPAATKEPAIKKGFLNKPVSAKTTSPEIQELPTPAPTPSSSPAQVSPAAPSSTLSSQPPATAAGGPIEPSYTLKERGNVSWGDFEQMRNNASKPPTSTRPAELICRIEIPKVTVMSEMVLDVSERRLQLSYRQEYLLSITLPYPVLDKKGAAKYDKSSKCLTVTLPVQPPTAPALDQSSKQPELSQPEEVKEDTDVVGPQETAPRKSREESHKRWVSGRDEAEMLVAEAMKEDIKKKAAEAAATAATVAPTRTTTPVFKPAPVHAVSQAGSDDTAEFSPSDTFAGKREGRVFKRGDKGVGYYRDRQSVVKAPIAEAAATAAEAATPTTGAAPTKSDPVKHKSFEFVARQTQQAVAVLVQVPGIDVATVNVTFQERLVQVRFSSSGFWYALDLVPLGDLNTDGCKFDVVQRNMVIVLAKLVEAHWDETDGSTDDLVVPKPYSGVVAKPYSGGDVGTSSSGASPSSASPAYPAKGKMAQAAESFALSQKSVLYELD